MYALWPTGRQGDFLNATISQVGDYTEKMRRLAGPSRAVYMVLQAFAWEDLRDKDRDPAMVLYPDRAQIKSMAYQAIVHGANGLLSGDGQQSRPERPCGTICAQSSRLAQLSAELAAPPLKPPLRIEYHDTGHSLDRGMEWTARPSGKGLVLFTVNSDENPVEACVTLPTGVASCQVVGSGETIPVTRGAVDLHSRRLRPRHCGLADDGERCTVGRAKIKWRGNGKPWSAGYRTPDGRLGGAPHRGFPAWRGTRPKLAIATAAITHQAAPGVRCSRSL